MKNAKWLIYISIVIAMTIGVFISYFKFATDNFVNVGISELAYFESEFKPSVQFIEMAKIYGEQFLDDTGDEKIPELFRFIEYDPRIDSYNMNAIGGTDDQKEAGNITGLGDIPDQGIAKRELILALSLNEYFNKFYNSLTDVAWVYYTSENGFINLYPWVSSDEFTFSETIKSLPFYSSVTPKNDPLRRIVWSPAYLDAGGKGIMITLSNPIYNGDDFVGAVSVDFTTRKFSEMLKSEYSSFLIDNESSVIACNKKAVNDQKILKLSDYITMPEKTLQEIDDAKGNSLQRVSNYLVYKSKIPDTSWTILLLLPINTAIGGTLLRTLPIVIISTLLLFAIKEAMKRREAEEQVRNAALTDPLTGLKNRRYLDAILEIEMERSDRYKQPLSIISLDLDHFKNVNDEWGHPVGDDVLKQIANLMKCIIRKSDALVRLGGEEFMILLPQTSLLGARQLAEKIRVEIEQNNHPVAGKHTASFGVAERSVGESYKSLYKKVDEALYRAKGRGRNQVVCYDSQDTLLAPYANVSWSVEWECGNKEIDLQHRRIIELGNELIAMSLSKADASSIETKLDDVINSLIEHFKYEEHILEEVKYPELVRHAEIHKELTTTTLKIKRSVTKGTTKSSDFFAFILEDAVVAHMLLEDVKFYPYLNNKV